MAWLVADIGGTCTRCALAGPDGTPNAIRTFTNRAFPGPGELLASYLDALPPAGRPEQALLAIAAPLRGDEIRMVNIDWAFSLSGLARRLALRRITPLNDFAAQAYALPVLGPDDLRQVGGGSPVPYAPRVVVGPGTGLGMAGLVHIGGRWHAIAGEGGHATLPPADEREARLIALGREHFGHCSAERLVSGPGLAFLYGALGGDPGLAPDEVGARIRAREPLALEVLEVFFRLLATVAGNLALTFASFGGVYIAGGITPRYVDDFLASGFRARFEARGRYRALLAAIPTWLVTTEDAALRGLAAFAAAESAGHGTGRD